MEIEFARIYFVRGGAPAYWRNRYEITDPPTSGHGHVAIIRGEKRSTLLCPFTLNSYQVSNRSGEMASLKAVPISVEKLSALITQSWEDCIKLGFQRDFGVAASILAALGQPVPKFLPPPIDPLRDDVKRGGKPIVPAALKPCRPNSKRGQVAAFFMQEAPQSLHEAMAKLELTRSGVLSHLFTLNRDHGVGYELVSDCARLLLPDGFDLFAYVEPEKPAKVEKTKTQSSDGAPKRRAGGKPIKEEALKPIPEPGKRAAVARLFVDGWANLPEACATLGLDRSAVLSHLFTINKENGLGYELSEDGLQARLLIPEGHEVFGAKQPRSKKPQVAEDASWLE